VDELEEAPGLGCELVQAPATMTVMATIAPGRAQKFNRRNHIRLNSRTHENAGRRRRGRNRPPYR
jgi:hypothetical protein